MKVKKREGEDWRVLYSSVGFTTQRFSGYTDQLSQCCRMKEIIVYFQQAAVPTIQPDSFGESGQVKFNRKIGIIEF